MPDEVARLADRAVAQARALLTSAADDNEAAEIRELAAARRDEAAAQRDRTSAERDLADAASDADPLAGLDEVRRRAAQSRADNAALRELAALDRFAAAADLESARLDRLRADADREALTTQLELLLQATTQR